MCFKFKAVSITLFVLLSALKVTYYLHIYTPPIAYEHISGQQKYKGHSCQTQYTNATPIINNKEDLAKAGRDINNNFTHPNGKYHQEINAIGHETGKEKEVI